MIFNLSDEKLDIAVDYIKGKIHDLQVDSGDEKVSKIVDSLEDLLTFIEKNRN